MEFTALKYGWAVLALMVPLAASSLAHSKPVSLVAGRKHVSRATQNLTNWEKLLLYEAHVLGDSLAAMTKATSCNSASPTSAPASLNRSSRCWKRAWLKAAGAAEASGSTPYLGVT